MALSTVVVSFPPLKLRTVSRKRGKAKKEGSILIIRERNGSGLTRDNFMLNDRRMVQEACRGRSLYQFKTKARDAVAAVRLR
jgi:hypothetical protein